METGVRDPGAHYRGPPVQAVLLHRQKLLMQKLEIGFKIGFS